MMKFSGVDKCPSWKWTLRIAIKIHKNKITLKICNGNRNY